MAEQLTAWHAVQVLAWIVTLLLAVGAFLFRSELDRLRDADASALKAIEKIATALGAIQASMPEKYVMRADMQNYTIQQAEDARALRAEIAALRSEMMEQISLLRQFMADLLGGRQ